MEEDGRVWTYAKKTLCWKHDWYYLSLLKRWKYLAVNLCNSDGRKTRSVHRLSAQTYIPNPNNYPVVRHLDNNPHNNHISNIEWCTHKTNSQQSWDDWLSYNSEKQRECSRKIWFSTGKPVMQLTKEWILCSRYNSLKQASEITWLSLWNIWCCVKWVRKHCWGYQWAYINS